MFACGPDAAGVHPPSVAQSSFAGLRALLALLSCPGVVQVMGVSPIVGRAAGVFLSSATRVILVGLRALLTLAVEFWLRLRVGLLPPVGPPLHLHAGLPMCVCPLLACGSTTAFLVRSRLLVHPSFVGMMLLVDPQLVIIGGHDSKGENR